MPEEALAYAVTYLEPMVQLPPRGVWGKRSRVRWQTFRGWLGADADTPSNVDDVAMRYLAAFGPASASDMRTWSGLPGLREVMERLAPQLRVFLDESGRQLLDLPEAPRPEPQVPAPVRFLPEYDNVLLSHDNRTRVIPDRRAVPLPPGQGARIGTVLVEGIFRATWRIGGGAGGAALLHVQAEPPLSRQQAREVEEEGSRLLGFVRPDSAGEVRINS